MLLLLTVLASTLVATLLRLSSLTSVSSLSLRCITAITTSGYEPNQDASLFIEINTSNSSSDFYLDWPSIMSATTKTDPPPPPPPVPPKRGGIVHPQFGRFIGGSKLNDATVGGNGTGMFRFSTQRRHEKTLASIEKTLRDARDSTTGIKFNGTLEPGRDNPSEIGKERFITLLKKRVTEHGQRTFYHIMDTDGKVVDLFENAHRFKLDYVVAEHKRRMETNRLHESLNHMIASSAMIFSCRPESWNPSRRRLKSDSVTARISSYFLVHACS